MFGQNVVKNFGGLLSKIESTDEQSSTDVLDQKSDQKIDQKIDNNSGG